MKYTDKEVQNVLTAAKNLGVCDTLLSEYSILADMLNVKLNPLRLARWLDQRTLERQTEDNRLAIRLALFKFENRAKA